jgi:hypothetical protein
LSISLVTSDPSLPQPEIGHLWRQVRQHPLDVQLWIALSQRYAMAGLAPQWCYVRRQVGRLNPATSASLPSPNDGDARAITAAEEHLTHSSANPAFLRLLAEKDFQHNNWREAIAVLQRADTLQSDNRDTLLALARIHWEVFALSEAEALSHSVLELDLTNHASFPIPRKRRCWSRSASSRNALAVIPTRPCVMPGPCSW